MKLTYSFLCLFIILLFSYCKKEPGEGGTSFIKGRVYAKYCNKNFSIMSDSAYAPDVDVYIIYGDRATYGERQRTTYDGTYEFRYLREGAYKVYAYSRDSTGKSKNKVNQYAPDTAIMQSVEITKKKETVIVPDIRILQ